MKAVLQRAARAKVTANGEATGEIGAGLAVLLGVQRGDTLNDVNYICTKIERLRIFPDENGVMNKSLSDLGLAVLIVSQFTLCADTRKGCRPSYSEAAPREEAEPLYLAAVKRLRDSGIAVSTGCFGADMQFEIVNDGPVTILLNSRQE